MMALLLLPATHTFENVDYKESAASLKNADAVNKYAMSTTQATKVGLTALGTTTF